MNMDNFDKDIWHLHRKLFHRFVKYSKYVRLATERLPDYVKAVKEQDALMEKAKREKLERDMKARK